MKKQLSFTLLTIVSLAAVLLNLSCGGASQNNTVGSNAVTGNAAPSNTAKSFETLSAVDCSGNATEKLKKIKDKIKVNIENDDRLNYQYDKRFFFEPVMDTNGNATLYIWGSIFISEKDDLDNLNKKYKDLFKKGCIEKAVFTSPPGKTAIQQSMEFTALCEAPNQICPPEGTCQEVCVKKDKNTNTNMNSKSNN